MTQLGIPPTPTDDEESVYEARGLYRTEVESGS